MICPIINIIAVSYHRPNDFELCIQSVIDNTDLPYKLTIIDNSSGGIDTSLNKYRKHANITIIKNNTNLGKGKSFKKYYKSICGNDDVYFVSLDADVIVPPNWLSKLITLIMDINIPFAAIAPVLIRDNNDSFDKQIRNGDIYMHGGTDNFSQLKKINKNLYATKSVAGPLLLLSCKFYKLIGGYPGDTLYGHDDGFICNKAIEYGHFVGITDIIECVHSNIDNTEEYQNWKLSNINNISTKFGYWDF